MGEPPAYYEPTKSHTMPLRGRASVHVKYVTPRCSLTNVSRPPDSLRGIRFTASRVPSDLFVGALLRHDVGNER
jgi:hypothetical protein